MKTIPVCTILAETSPQALPLGAACIVSSINQYFSENPVFQDKVYSTLNFYSAEDNISAQEIAKTLLSYNPPAICFSVFVWNHKILSEVAKILRKTNPDIFLIAGGPEVTALSSEFKEFDFLVTGEGESVVPKLLQDILTNSKSLQKPQAKPVILHGTRVPPEKLPSPYLDGTLNPSHFDGGALWELARGCPFKCSYCYESKGEKTVCYFPMERIKQELQYFNKTGVQQVFVLDPTYNAQKKRALEILSLIKKDAPNTFFHFECRAEFLDSELVKAFSKIPCSLQIGLQSADEKVLSLVNRNFNRKDFSKKIALLNNFGVIFGFDLIFGLPSDTLQGFMDSIDFAINLYPNSLELFRLSVLPGTTLYDNHKELGLIAQTEPPYLVQSSDTFSPRDLDKAEEIAFATSLFYSAGRAVPWFHSVLKPLKCKPSVFFLNFSQFLKRTRKNNLKQCPNHMEIEKLQCAFITEQYKQHKLDRLLFAALDLIKLNGAYSRAYADNLTSKLNLSYHPDDLFSPYTEDLFFFCKNAQKGHFSIKMKPSSNGPVWENTK